MIGRFWIDYKPLTRLWNVPHGFLFSEKMTSLDILDMHLVILGVFSQYLRLGWRLVVINI
jgi:hypothetical protein